jgi:hypothetical protein
MSHYIVSNDNIKKNMLKEISANDINILNINKSNDYINIFINMSIQSNSFTNILKDKNKIIGNKCNIYVYKYDNIIYIMSIDIVDNTIYDKLINIIFNQEIGYYSKDKQMIFDFIKVNNLEKYLLYN